MNNRISVRIACAALASVATAPLSLAYAQDVQPSQVEEVVVTARRHAEDIQRVPMSVTALGSKQIAEQNITTQSDLQSAVPGLTLRQTQGSNSLTYSIRGQTVDVFTGSATAVVPYFNEVQLFNGGAATFFDLDSIQVLKGPQGTLFGRNATGGAVLYTSQKPTDDFGGYITARAGSYGMVEGTGAINIPIVDDKLMLRVAGDMINQEGYQLNVFTGQHLGRVVRDSGRVSLTWKPTEHFENTLVVEIDSSGGNSTANRLYTVNRCGTTHNGFALNCTADSLYNPATPYGAAVWADYIANNPQANPAGIGAWLDNNSKQLKFWQADEISPVIHHAYGDMATNTTTYDISTNMQFKNIFGASLSGTQDEGSSVGSPYLVFTSENPGQGLYGNRNHLFSYSDEAQIQGTTLDDDLTYIVGAYYQSTTTNTVYPQIYFDFSPDVPGSALDDHFRIKDRTQAVYAEGNYKLDSLGLKNFTFTAGYRYSWEEYGIDQLAGGVNPIGSQQTTFSNPSWSLGLSYQASDDLMFYVEGRRSWRAGGFNGTAPAISTGAAGGGNMFEPEYTRDVEGGVKFSPDVMGRSSHFNLAVYNQWIDNVQRAEFPVGPRGQSIAVTINVPGAEVTGLELDTGIDATDWLELGFSGALTDARFLKGQNQALIFGQPFVFGPYGDAPKASGSFYARVALPTPAQWGAMSLRADLYSQTGMYFSNNASTTTPHTRIPGYGLLNLRYDWSNILGSNFSAAVYAKNVMDKEYYTGGFSLSGSLGVSSASVGTPRMVGGELTYNF
jgi:iron complex outermembrane receptor protein